MAKTNAEAKKFAKDYIKILAMTNRKPDKKTFLFDYPGEYADGELIWYYIDLEV